MERTTGRRNDGKVQKKIQDNNGTFPSGYQVLNKTYYLIEQLLCDSIAELLKLYINIKGSHPQPLK